MNTWPSRKTIRSSNDVCRKWWAVMLERLEEDPMQLTREVDWVTKRHLIQSYMEKKGCGWDDPRVFLHGSAIS